MIFEEIDKANTAAYRAHIAELSKEDLLICLEQAFEDDMGGHDPCDRTKLLRITHLLERGKGRVARHEQEKADRLRELLEV